MDEVKPGTILKGSNWPEPVEIKLFEDFGEYIHIVGATTLSGTHIDQIIPRDEFPFPPPIPEPNLFTEEPWKVFLALETRRYRFASIYDPPPGYEHLQGRSPPAPDRSCLWLCPSTSSHPVPDRR